MKTIRLFVIPLLAIAALAQLVNGLASEMARLRIHTALLIPSQAVDESPVWSPDSRYLGANIQGQWFKLDTSKVRLQEATWHRQKIGAIAKPTLEPLAKSNALAWAKQEQRRTGDATGKSGIKAARKSAELSTSLVLSKGTGSWVVWRSDLENCGELTMSPDGVYLAYICETNGVIVTDMEQALQALGPEP